MAFFDTLVRDYESVEGLFNEEIELEAGSYNDFNNNDEESNGSDEEGKFDDTQINQLFQSPDALHFNPIVDPNQFLLPSNSTPPSLPLKFEFNDFNSSLPLHPSYQAPLYFPLAEQDVNFLLSQIQPLPPAVLPPVQIHPPLPPRDGNYMDISPFVRYPMREAAKKVKIPCSTLGKRWKAATMGRQWPYRKIRKLEKEIETLVYNSCDATAAEDRERLGCLVEERKTEIYPVFIRVCPGNGSSSNPEKKKKAPVKKEKRTPSSSSVSSS